MQRFTNNVIAIIKNIPVGKVTTYGLIATCAGNHCGARQVVRILHSSSARHQLPWFRVINGKGEIPERKSMSHLQQQELLAREGVVSAGGKIDLERYLWIPRTSELP